MHVVSYVRPRSAAAHVAGLVEERKGHSQRLARAEGNVWADVPFHAAVQALARVCAVKEPRQPRVRRVDDGLAAPWPFSRLEALYEACGELLVEGLPRLRRQKTLCEVDGKSRVLVLMLAGKT